jgi:hypothetical protein
MPSSFMWFFAGLFALSFVSLTGCGDDGGGAAGTGGSGGLAVPTIPEPTSFLDVDIPTKSLELIVETTVLSNFAPVAIQATNQVHRTDGNIFCEDNDPDYAECSCWNFDFIPGGKDFQPIVLVKDGEILPDPEANRCEYYSTGGRWAVGDIPISDAEFVAEANDVTLKPLSTQPRLQLVRYWILNPKGEGDPGCWYVDSASTQEANWTKTEGITQTTADEFAETISANVGVTDPWGVLTDTLTTEFSHTVSSSIAFNHETTTGGSRSITCPIDKRCVFCVWQLFEEYRYVDVDDDLFRDPNWEFGYEVRAAHMGWTGEVVRRSVVPQTTLFDRAP